MDILYLIIGFVRENIHLFYFNVPLKTAMPLNLYTDVYPIEHEMKLAYSPCFVDCDTLIYCDG